MLYTLMGENNDWDIAQSLRIDNFTIDDRGVRFIVYAKNSEAFCRYFNCIQIGTSERLTNLSFMSTRMFKHITDPRDFREGVEMSASYDDLGLYQPGSRIVGVCGATWYSRFGQDRFENFGKWNPYGIAPIEYEDGYVDENNFQNMTIDVLIGITFREKDNLSCIVSTNEQDTMNVQGVLLSAEGGKLADLQSLHNGMGYFSYTPDKNWAKAEVTYQGKHYSFELPEALPAGYVLRVDNRPNTISVTVTRSSAILADTLGLFLFSQGRPYIYKPVTFDNQLSQVFSIPVAELPQGVLRLSLLTTVGKVLSDRFCYRMPDDTLRININADKKVYKPFEKIYCRIKVSDKEGHPLKGQCSVTVRDRILSDYQEYDNTIYTDLLLTSDLKGYIHQPGYYFAARTASRQNQLDVLLMIRGWRKYDMAKLIGQKQVNLEYKPETTLNLYGQVNSLFGKPQAKIDVSILARKD